jgi:tRNA nucleotidyltransferase (CCA-adding enzyme)
LLGRHLIALGQKPSPGFTAQIHAAFEAQLDGAFTDEEGALIWSRNNLHNTGPHRS